MSHAGVYLFIVSLCFAAIFGFASLRRRAGEVYESTAVLAKERAGTGLEMKASSAAHLSAESSLIGPPFVMKTLVTLAILGAALYIILSRKFGNDQEKWAFGAIGTILGYWLKG